MTGTVGTKDGGTAGGELALHARLAVHPPLCPAVTPLPPPRPPARPPTHPAPPPHLSQSPTDRWAMYSISARA